MKVELLFFYGCPNWTITQERLQTALDHVGVSAEIEHCRVDSEEEAIRQQFAGSPSIRINGKDPFHSPSAAFGLTCRIYSTPDGPAGAPTLEQVVEVVKAAATG
ncbi:MAG TPA: thioredoxin family protein [Acidimicrobiales bacterium]|nr:thioredoxin family protein [Acidimicrobiales bacterium]